MRIILAIFVGAIIYLLSGVMLTSSKESGRSLVKKQLNQIRRMGDAHGENKKKKRNSMLAKRLEGSIKRMASHVGTIISISDKERKRTEQFIIQGGMNMLPEEYIAFEIMAVLFGGLCGIAYVALFRISILPGFVFGLLVGYTIFRYYMKKRVEDRKRIIRRQLPETVDLLALCVESGLSFNQGIQYILQKSEGPLIDEFEIALKRMNLGESRRLALETLSEHCGLEEVTIFTSSVVQAEELGLPMKDVLVTQSRQGRIVRRMKIEEAAQKLTIKIMFPLIFLILPTLFIIILGPAIPQFLFLFQNM